MTEERKKSNIELIIEFSKRILALEAQKKALAADIKALKGDFSAQSLDVSAVMKAIKHVKSLRKQDDGARLILENIVEVLQESKEVCDEIDSLNSK